MVDEILEQGARWSDTVGTVRQTSPLFACRLWAPHLDLRRSIDLTTLLDRASVVPGPWTKPLRGIGAFC